TFFVAWGDNFSTFYHLLFDHLPYFNKFRTPSMIFYLTTIITAITSALTLQYIINNGEQRELIWKKFSQFSIGFVGVLFILVILGPILFSFSSQTMDGQLQSQLMQMTQNNTSLTQAILDALIQDRKSLMRADTLRSLIFVALTAGVITLYL